MTRLNTISDQEAATLRELIAWYRTRDKSTVRPNPTQPILQSSEVYVAKVPSGGVAAMSGVEPSSVECDIYRLIDIGTAAPTMQRVVGLTRTVYNIFCTDIGGQQYVPVARDKFGKWFFTYAPICGDACACLATGEYCLYSDAGGVFGFGTFPGAPTTTGSGFGPYCTVQNTDSWAGTASGVSRWVVYLDADAGLWVVKVHYLPEASCTITTDGGETYHEATAGVTITWTASCFLWDGESDLVFTYSSMVETSTGLAAGFALACNITVQYTNWTLMRCPIIGTSTAVLSPGWLDVFSDSDGITASGHIPDFYPGGTSYVADVGVWKISSNRLRPDTLSAGEATISFDPLCQPTVGRDLVFTLRSTDPLGTSGFNWYFRGASGVYNCQVSLSFISGTDWTFSLTDGTNTDTSTPITLLDDEDYELVLDATETDIFVTINADSGFVTLHIASTVDLANTQMKIQCFATNPHSVELSYLLVAT